MTKKISDIRLAQHVQPSRYELTIRPDLEKFTFSGEERISLALTKKDSAVTLHAVDIKIEEAFWYSGKTKLQSHDITYDTKRETATISFSKPLSGKGILHLTFTGILNNVLRGFYRSSYTHKGKQKYLATTQFEATDARRAFPCFDEPSHKAVFDVTCIIPKHLTAISNSIDIKTSKHDSEYKVVKFAPTPKMSTYLLAFIVGEFESVKTKSKQGTTIRIFTTPGKIKQAAFALEVAKRSLEFLNDYFAIKYPLPVLDLIAIPDFSAGAMENWGAVTFREEVLLVDEKLTPFLNRQRVAEVIAHELVHQWFGNLVTMEWWTHLWLNESFADYMAHVTLDALFPEWNIWTKFTLSEHLRGLKLDSLNSTHPIEVDVQHPDEIGQIFDAISYSKGASVLRMLSHYIGPDGFRDGLRMYLKKHSYKNTSSVHLWESFERASKKPVKKLMHTWITEPNYPVVSVQNSKNKIQFKQEPFILLPKKGKQRQGIWTIPLQAQLSPDTQSDMYVLHKQQGSLEIPADFAFTKLNPHQTGFYRTHYDSSLLARLFMAIENEQLSVIDQLGLFNDLAELAKAGRLTTDVCLEAFKFVREKNSFVLWTEISHVLAEIEQVFTSSPYLDAYASSLFIPILNHLGFEPRSKDTNSQAMLRSVALFKAAHHGYKPAIDFGKQKFAHIAKGGAVKADMRSSIYTIASEYGGKKEFDSMLLLHKKAILQEERKRLGMALMRFQDTRLLNQAIEILFTDNVRSQDVPSWVSVGMSKTGNREIVWEAICSRWDELVGKLGKGSLLSSVISTAGSFSTDQHLKQISEFYKSHSHAGSEQAVAKAKENIAINIQWAHRDAKIVSQYLKQNS